jgi:hypothetical protein
MRPLSWLLSQRHVMPARVMAAINPGRNGLNTVQPAVSYSVRWYESSGAGAMTREVIGKAALPITV